MDVYDPGTGLQLHDLNPSDFHPTGLFWTTELKEKSVEVKLDKGDASLEAKDVAIYDYGQITNSLFGGSGRTPGKVSFKVRWSGDGDRIDIRNTDPVYGGFAGTFVRNSAQMEWTAETEDYKFDSAPMKTSSSEFAEIGAERNGSFFA